MSQGSGSFTWSQVAASARGFAFRKAAQGDYFTDPDFATNWAGTKAAAVYRSPYHFFDPTIDGVTQANHFLATLTAAGGLEAGDLPPMLDIECPTSSDPTMASPNCEHTGDSGWVATATMSQRIFDWLTTVEAATGRVPIVYSYPSWFADVGFTDPKLASYPLFIATLGACASVPAPWTTAVFWQYSFTGTVPGVPGQVDLDRFFGTLAQLGSFANGSADAGADATSPDARSADGGSSAGPPDGT